MKEQYIHSTQLSESTIRRFHLYKPLLRLWKYKNKSKLTISIISELLGIDELIVIEDFSCCPHLTNAFNDSLEIDTMIDCIDLMLGRKEFKETLIIGVGRLGTSLLKNEEIVGSGLKIVAAFEIDPLKVGKILSGIKVLPMDKLEVYVRQMHIKMAMIATTPQNAIDAASQAIHAGIQVIWNFTPANIPEIDGIIIQNSPSGKNIETDYQSILSKLS